MPFNLEIVSPARLLLSQPAEMVTMPAAEGEMGVLPGHSPMIVLLRAGTVRIQGGPTLYVSGGFAEVTPDRCTILADDAVPVDELSRADAQARLEAARAAFTAADKMDMTAVDATMAQVQAAEARVAAAGVA
jgi:F-type H+-transporting ATPase subunit epsilon